MIRAADVRELTTLAEIYLAAWRFAFAKHFPAECLSSVTLKDFEDRWRVYFQDAHTRSFVYEHRSVPAAFITSRPREGNQAEILSLMVAPAFIRSGIGSKLMEKALIDLQESECSLADLWVVQENSRARRFYEQFGFSPTDDKRLISRYGVELRQMRYEKWLYLH